MALLNLVRVVSSTTGTGASLDLGTNVAGFVTPTQAGSTDGEVYSYGIEAFFDGDGVAQGREQGFGVLSGSGTVLSRNPITSTNANAALDLTADQQIIITPLESDFGPAGTGAEIAFRNFTTGTIGTWGADPDFTFTPNLGLLMSDHVAFGNYADLTAVTFRPGDPVGSVTYPGYVAVAAINAYEAGPIVEAEGLGIFVGVKATSGTSNFFYGLDIESTINSDSLSRFSTISNYIASSNFGFGPIDVLEGIVIISENYGSGSISSLFGSETQAIIRPSSSSAVGFVYGAAIGVKNSGSGNIATIHGIDGSINHDGSGTVGEIIGVNCAVASSSGDVTGIFAGGFFQAAAQVADVDSLVGGHFLAKVELFANVASYAAAGEFTFLAASSSSLTPLAYGVLINAPVIQSGVPAIPSAYGIWIDDWSNLGTTKSINIHSAGVDSINEFEGSLVMGTGAIATTTTSGIYLASGAGPPTGVPTSFTGRVLLYYDSVNNQLYIYNGGWKQPKTPGAAAIVNWQ